MAAPAVRSRPRRLPRRRHGTRQDDPGALALLLVEQAARRPGRRPSLLVAPASLLANWAAEIERFAPSLKAAIVHPSAMTAEQVKAFTPNRRRTMIWRSPATARCCASRCSRRRTGASSSWTRRRRSRTPNAKQTRAAKALKATARIALTGTPVENHLGDLWSIFDFINPGLLGTAKAVHPLHQRTGRATHNPYGPLRELVRPYILRRMKTDKSVIADLPDKTEVKALCRLARKQAALYDQAVDELAEAPRRRRRHSAQGHRPGDADAAQADLQPSLAVAERQCLGRGGQRQVGTPARDRRGGRRAAGEDAGVHAVPRDDRRRWRPSWGRFSAAPAWCCTARPR